MSRSAGTQEKQHGANEERARCPIRSRRATATVRACARSCPTGGWFLGKAPMRNLLDLAEFGPSGTSHDCTSRHLAKSPFFISVSSPPAPRFILLKPSPRTKPLTPSVWPSARCVPGILPVSKSLTSAECELVHTANKILTRDEGRLVRITVRSDRSPRAARFIDARQNEELS